MKTPETAHEVSGAESGPATPTGPGVVSTGWLAAQSAFDHRDSRKLSAGLGVSLALHGVVLAIIIAIFSFVPQETLTELPNDLVRLVYMQQPGPGGGGGGSPAPAPPKPIEVPRVKAPEPIPVVVPPPVPPPPKPPPQLTAPVMTNNQDLVQTTGVSAISLTRYGGEGRGRGLGAGQGSGVGPGEGGGIGGGVYKPGAGLSDPVPVREMKPQFTPEALRAKIQGSVLLQVVVRKDGTVTDVSIVKSLDRVYGLDEAAIAAAKGWLFKPAMKQGQPVDMYILLELSFRTY